MNKKIESVKENGKAALKVGVAKGDALMDKVPFLKQNPVYKKVIWGVMLAVIILIPLFSIFSGPSVGDIEKETVALFHQHGADGVTAASLKKVGKGVYSGAVTANGEKFDVTIKYDGKTIEATGEAVTLYRLGQVAEAIDEALDQN